MTVIQFLDNEPIQAKSTLVACFSGVIILEIIRKITLWTVNKCLKHKTKYKEPIKKVEVTLTLAMPASQVRDCKQFFKNEFPKLLTNNPDMDYKNVCFNESNTKKFVYKEADIICPNKSEE